jgi:hypothetical protein
LFFQLQLLGLLIGHPKTFSLIRKLDKIYCFEVYYARKKTYVEANPKNYISWLPVVIGLLGIGFLGLNLYHMIFNLQTK